MSSFLCDNWHLSLLGACAVLRSGLDISPAKGKTASDVARLLYDANQRSLEARYGAPDAWPFEFDSDAHALASRLTPAEIINAVRCYEYQASEFRGWGTSDAHAIAQAIFHQAVADVARDAPWGAPSKKALLAGRAA